MATQKGKKRKGLRKAKHCAAYKLGGILNLNRVRRAQTQKRHFLKRLRKVTGLTKEITDKLLSKFMSCKKCKKQGRVLIPTVAPIVEKMGGYCVRCGFHPEVSAG